MAASGRLTKEDTVAEARVRLTVQLDYSALARQLRDIADRVEAMAQEHTDTVLSTEDLQAKPPPSHADPELIGYIEDKP